FQGENRKDHAAVVARPLEGRRLRAARRPRRVFIGAGAAPRYSVAVNLDPVESIVDARIARSLHDGRVADCRLRPCTRAKAGNLGPLKPLLYALDDACRSATAQTR